MTTEITYILSSEEVTFMDIDEIYSLDEAKEAAKERMRKDSSIEAIEINRKDSRFAGYDYEGKMERNDDSEDGFYFDSMRPEPPIRFLIITGYDDNQELCCEEHSPDNAIDAWCNTIKVQGTIEHPWICRIQEEIYSDDGEWCDMYDGEPWNGFYIRREF